MPSNVRRGKRLAARRATEIIPSGDVPYGKSASSSIIIITLRLISSFSLSYTIEADSIVEVAPPSPKTIRIDYVDAQQLQSDVENVSPRKLRRAVIKRKKPPLDDVNDDDNNDEDRRGFLSTIVKRRKTVAAGFTPAANAPTADPDADDVDDIIVVPLMPTYAPMMLINQINQRSAAATIASTTQRRATNANLRPLCAAVYANSGQPEAKSMLSGTREATANIIGTTAGAAEESDAYSASSPASPMSPLTSFVTEQLQIRPLRPHHASTSQRRALKPDLSVLCSAIYGIDGPRAKSALFPNAADHPQLMNADAGGNLMAQRLTDIESRVKTVEERHVELMSELKRGLLRLVAKKRANKLAKNKMKQRIEG